MAIAQKAIVERELATGVLIAPFDFVLDRKAHTYYFVWPDDRAESKALTAFKRWLSEVV